MSGTDPAIIRVQLVEGDAFEIPPGHDAWVVGDEPWVTVEWTSARSVGIAPEMAGRVKADAGEQEPEVNDHKRVLSGEPG
jgi:hypothetical protein